MKRNCFHNVEEEKYKGKYGAVFIEGLSSNWYHFNLAMMSLNYVKDEWFEEGDNEYVRTNLLTFSSNQEQLNSDIFVGGEGSNYSNKIHLDRTRLDGLDEITLTF
ncbi:hypothetical protein AB3N04_19725 [Alkalihalophilus sp. As8PL]|uniref:Uncharacterized protein n=1 Tax=Alkalihalophilus sp. As8PL TaxID=3237103 RepID=A0AB39BU75_9BACI